MTPELESYRSSNSSVLMYAPFDIPEICARLDSLMRLKEGGLAIDAMSIFRHWNANDASLNTSQHLDTLVHL
jgi:hypothetical protein